MKDQAKKNAINKAYYERNKERILGKLKFAYDTNLDGIRDKKIARDKDYREGNPEKIRVAKQRDKIQNPIRHTLYWRWKNMMNRCFDDQDKDFVNYGGRGIVVEEPLTDFNKYRDFVMNLAKPDGFDYSAKFHLDRIDNDASYKVGNLRWVTVKENLENSRNSKNNPLLKKRS